MTDASREALSALVRALPLEPWSGEVWRTHWRNVDPADWHLSLRTSGRYHRGRDLFPESEVWPALYTSLAPEVAVWELVRQRTSSGKLEFLRNNRLTRMRVSLRTVLDCRDSVAHYLPVGALRGTDRFATWALAEEAIAAGADALLVPSAGLPGDNLVIFPSNLPADWAPESSQSEDMPLD